MSPERVSVREGHSMYRSKDRKDAGTNNRETQEPTMESLV